MLYSLYWKEWRETRALRWSLWAATLVSPFLLAPLFAMSLWDARQAAGALPALFALLFGAQLFRSRELEPGLAQIYHLPLARARMLWPKLAVLTVHLVVVSLLAAAVASPTLDDRESRTFFLLSLFCVVPFALSAAITRFHVRSSLTASLLSVLIATPAGAAVLYAGSFDSKGDLTAAGLPWLLLTCVAVVLLLGAWLFHLFCRTAIVELRDTARFFLFLLFAVTLTEVLYTLFICNYRDLVYVVLGL